ncbi:MAG: RNA polymerase-binding protein DksA [SAR324 cluster bacterium]|nr:RNA polymerase-binding protein DksA [SAR324 cluster bacterium]
MEPKDLEYFKDKLLEMKTSLQEESSSTMEEMKNESSLFPDPNDRASLENDRGIVLRIRDRERKLLTKVEEALARIDDGTFGLCERCEEEIGRARLDIRPVTTFCINCKEEMEASEK